MRRARRQQAHADDMLFLRRLLPQLRQIGFARGQVAGHAGHEQHQQHRDHGEADPGADDVQIEQAALQRVAEVQRAIEEGETGGAQHGDGDDAPHAPAMEQHRAQRDLKQIERDEGIGRAAAHIELGGKREDVEQQRQEQFGMGDVGAPPQYGEAGQVHASRDAGDDQHRHHRQADAHTIMDDQDGSDLTRQRDPAQLHQQRHILAPGSVGWPLAGQPAGGDRQAQGHGRRL